MAWSRKLSAAARIRTNTCAGRGWGSGSSTTWRLRAPLEPLGILQARIKRRSSPKQRSKCAVPPHDDARHEQHGGHQADERPHGTQRLVVAPAAEVQSREPHQYDITHALAVLGVRVGKLVDEISERLGNAEIEAR